MTVLHHGLYNFTVFFLLDIFVYIFYEFGHNVRFLI